MNTVYLDSSAAYKLVGHELESAPLMVFLSQWSDVATSRLAQLEVGRAVRRHGLTPDLAARLTAVWNRLTIAELSPAVLRAAELIEPFLLRSLDAIHLASALDLGLDLAGLVAYDRRLLAAASALGIPTFSPR